MRGDREIILSGNSPSELKADPFLNRLFFQYVEDWMIVEAERREDTWDFLLAVRGLRLGCYDFFKAARSVSYAAHKLQHMLYGWFDGKPLCGANVSRFPFQEMVVAKKAGHDMTAKAAAVKFFRPAYMAGFWQDPLDTYNFKTTEEREEFEKLRQKEEKTLCKRHGRNWRGKFKPASTEEIQNWNQLAHFLVHAWLRWGVGEPGLCFYNGEAVSEIYDLLRGEPLIPIDSDYCKKMRQRLGLQQAFRGKPIVTHAVGAPGGLIDILCPTKTSPEGKHRLSPQNSFALGRLSYPTRS